MSKCSNVWVVILAGSLVVGMLAGCDATDDSNDPSTDVSGAWLYSDTESDQTTWALVQSEDGIIDGAATDGAMISGLLEADDIELTLTYSDDDISTLSGTVDTNVMTGTYTSDDGSGSWSAVKTD